MNGATRTVHVWLANDEPLYREIGAMAAVCADASDLADAIKQFVTDLVSVPESGLRADLIGSALAEVDWREIADAWSD